MGEFDLAYMTLVSSAYHMPEVEVLLVTGGVRTDEDLYRLRRAVRRAEEVVAVGTCAISGGIANLGNRPEVREVFLAHAERIHLPHLLPKCPPIDVEVKVDRYLPGCPPTPELYMAVLRRTSDFKAAASVCQECGRKKPKDMSPPVFQASNKERSCPTSAWSTRATCASAFRLVAAAGRCAPSPDTHA